MSEKENETPQEGAEHGGDPDRLTPEQLRQIDEEIRKVRMEDVLVQSVVSILNMAARRIAKQDERDLDQGRLGIDAAKALLDLLPDEQAKQAQHAVTELQLLYARVAAGGGEGEPGTGGAEDEPGGGEDEGKRDSGLWTPGS